MFSVYYHDKLDHCFLLSQFDSLVDAQREFNECLASEPEAYDYGYELVNESNPMEWDVLDFQTV